MNIPLLDPFESNQFPEIIEDILEEAGQATICAFNRRGTLLAVGCTTGAIAVIDFVTRGIATYHTSPADAPTHVLSVLHTTRWFGCPPLRVCGVTDAVC